MESRKRAARIVLRARSGGKTFHTMHPLYYLAVFSLIPFLGIPLGLAAFVLGILGLGYRRSNPTARGAVHAWIGIILGGLCGFGYLALIIFAIIAANNR